MSVSNISWDSLAQSIEDGEAILILGPDAIPLYPINGNPPAEETTFSTRVIQRISDNLGGQVSHFYQRDNLFQFANSNAKHQALKEVRSVARDSEWIPDRELVRQILEMPFPVILNINPDKFIYKAFLEYYQEPQFDFFTTKDKPYEPGLVYPNGHHKPLVYNLCGSVLDKLDSVILDYNDLLGLIKNLLMDTGVSEHLVRKLQEADRYVLLGFDLERWHSQILLHYLNKQDNNYFNNPNVNFPILTQISEDSRSFVMNQFNIKHIATTRREFEELHHACSKRNILRKLHGPASEVEIKIRSLTAQGKFEEVFQILETQSNPEHRIDLWHMKARYNTWIGHKNAGTLDSRDLDLEFNRIRYVLITYANQGSPVHANK
jgi:hypothetical protein